MVQPKLLRVKDPRSDSAPNCVAKDAKDWVDLAAVVMELTMFN